MSEEGRERAASVEEVTETEEDRFLRTALVDSEGFQRVARTGRLPLILHARALLDSAAVQPATTQLLSTNDKTALWQGLLLSMERAAHVVRDYVPIVPFLGRAAVELACVGRLSRGTFVQMGMVRKAMESVSSTRRWAAGNAGARVRDGLQDLRETTSMLTTGDFSSVRKFAVDDPVSIISLWESLVTSHRRLFAEVERGGLPPSGRTSRLSVNLARSVLEWDDAAWSLDTEASPGTGIEIDFSLSPLPEVRRRPRNPPVLGTASSPSPSPTSVEEPPRKRRRNRKKKSSAAVASPAAPGPTAGANSDPASPSRAVVSAVPTPEQARSKLEAGNASSRDMAALCQQRSFSALQARLLLWSGERAVRQAMRGLLDTAQRSAQELGAPAQQAEGLVQHVYEGFLALLATVRSILEPLAHNPTEDDPTELGAWLEALRTLPVLVTREAWLKTAVPSLSRDSLRVGVPATGGDESLLAAELRLVALGRQPRDLAVRKFPLASPAVVRIHCASLVCEARDCSGTTSQQRQAWFAAFRFLLDAGLGPYVREAVQEPGPDPPVPRAHEPGPDGRTPLPLTADDERVWVKGCAEAKTTTARRMIEGALSALENAWVRWEERFGSLESRDAAIEWISEAWRVLRRPERGFGVVRDLAYGWPEEEEQEEEQKQDDSKPADAVVAGYKEGGADRWRHEVVEDEDEWAGFVVPFPPPIPDVAGGFEWGYSEEASLLHRSDDEVASYQLPSTSHRADTSIPLPPVRAHGARLAEVSATGTSTGAGGGLATETASDVRMSATPKPSIRPTHFVGVRLKDATLWDALRGVQESIKATQKTVRSAMVPVEDLHITLCVLALPDECLQERAVSHFYAMRERIQRAFQGVDTDDCESTGHSHLVLQGLGTFRGQVLFALPAQDAAMEALQRIQHLISQSFHEEGLTKESQEGRDFDPTFKPHATVAKLSKWRGPRNKRPKSIGRKGYEAHEEQYFGSAPMLSVELLAMQSRDESRDGFYTSIASIDLSPRHGTGAREGT